MVGWVVGEVLVQKKMGKKEKKNDVDLDPWWGCRDNYHALSDRMGFGEGTINVEQA